MAALALASEHLRHEDERAGVEVLRGALAGGWTAPRYHPWLSPAEESDLCALALEHGIASGSTSDRVRARRLPPSPRARVLESWPWSLRVLAFGTLTVLRDETPIVRGRGQQRPLELLALLVAFGPGGASADEVAELLWPQSDGDAARIALDTLVYRLRRLLGDRTAVVHQAGRIGLDPAQVFVDAWAVDSLLDRVEAAVKSRASLEPAALRSRIQAITRGEDLLLAMQVPPVIATRERIRRRLARVLRA
jgi:hypothetical protein